MRFQIAERSRIRTIEVRDLKEVKIVKQMKVLDELVQIELIHQYDMTALINHSGSF